MHIYQTQKDIEKDIKDGVLTIDEDVTFKCSFKIEAELKVAGDIDARNIDAWDITAGGITARDITARDIIAGNIIAWNIDAWNIDAGDISFHACAFAYVSFKCKSIVGRRDKSKYFCLDSEVEINPNKLKKES